MKVTSIVGRELNSQSKGRGFKYHPIPFGKMVSKSKMKKNEN